MGIVGDEDNPANALFYLVLLTGMIGSLIARFQPRGMAVAAWAAAAVHGAVAVVALFLWRAPGTSVALNDVLINGFFVFLLVVAATLLRQPGGARA